MHYIPTPAHRDNVDYGDMNPVTAGNEAIQFDDFEMDQTSMKRTAMSHALDVGCMNLLVSRIRRPCIHMKSMHMSD